MSQRPIDDFYLEQQYNNRARVSDHPVFLQGWRQRSEAYRRQAQHAVLDLRYGERPREVLDLFPATATDAPVHVFIHGGYWQSLDKNSFSYLAERINRAGESAVIVNYDLCPDVGIDQIIQQIVSAITWVADHFTRSAMEPAELQLTGHSAGGHLAAALLARRWAPAGVRLSRVNCLSGLFDLQPLVATSINQALRLDQAAARALSPLFEVPAREASATQLNLYVGELESEEYFGQSQRLVDTWQGQVDVHTQTVPAVHHFAIVDAFFEDFYCSLAAQ